MNAFENSLRGSVRPGNVSASGAFLRSISGVNMVHFDGFYIGLVGQELLELEETPGVNLAILTLSPLGSFTDMLEVFEDDDAVFGERLYDLLRNAMVHVTPEAVLLGSHLLKVSFGGLGTTFLKLSSQAQVAMSDSSLVVEFVVGTDGYLVNSTVYTEDGWIVGILEFWNIFLKNDAEEDFTFSEDEFRPFASPGNVLLIVVRQVESNFDPTVKSENRNFAPIEPDTEASGGISDRRQLAMRALATLLNSGFECFGGFHPGLDSEVSRKSKGCSNMFVGLVMQRNGVEVFILISDLTNVIESTSNRFERWPDLFRSHRQLDLSSASQCFHVHIILKQLTKSSPSLSTEVEGVRAWERGDYESL